jgi:hypothetical protein
MPPRTAPQEFPPREKIFSVLESREFRPASPMYKAQQYILKNRKGLSLFTSDGRLPIDNNPAERAIRRVAIGRKNWLFLGSETGGEDHKRWEVLDEGGAEWIVSWWMWCLSLW